MLKTSRRALQKMVGGMYELIGTNVYEAPLSQESLQLAQTYARGFPFMVHDSVNERSLELAGVNVERPRTSQAILEEIRHSDFIECKRGGLPLTVERYLKGNNALNLDISSYLKDGCHSTLIGVKNDKKLTKKDVRVFTERLKRGYLCWKPSRKKEKVLGHLRDMKEGGCIPFIVDKENNPKGSEPYAFNRLFVLKDAEGEKELFWDTIEGNDTRSGLGEWTRYQRKTIALALSIFTSISVAQQMGAKRLYIPEDEIKSFFERLIGSKDSWPFKRYRGEKIGIHPDTEDEIKPYFYHLDRSRKKFAYVPIYDVNLVDYLKKAQQLSEMLSSFERGIGKEKTQRKIKTCMNGLQTSVAIVQVYQEGFMQQVKTAQETLIERKGK